MKLKQEHISFLKEAVDTHEKFTKYNLAFINFSKKHNAGISEDPARKMRSTSSSLGVT
jgi:hypothetical protein